MPFWEQLILVIIPMVLMIAFFWFMFPKLIRLIAKEDFNPLHRGKKKQLKILVNKSHKFLMKHGFIEKPKRKRFTTKEKKELK